MVGIRVAHELVEVTIRAFSRRSSVAVQDAVEYSGTRMPSTALTGVMRRPSVW